MQCPSLLRSLEIHNQSQLLKGKSHLLVRAPRQTKAQVKMKTWRLKERSIYKSYFDTKRSSLTKVKNNRTWI